MHAYKICSFLDEYNLTTTWSSYNNPVDKDTLEIPVHSLLLALYRVYDTRHQHHRGEYSFTKQAMF